VSIIGSASVAIRLAALLTVMLVANRRWLGTRDAEATLPTIDPS